MASMQCYQTVEETRTQVSYPPMTNQGQTQYYGTKTYSIYQPPATEPCMDQNKGHGYGSGMGMTQTYNGMGTTHASHGSNHCQDKNKNHGHGMTHTHSSNGHGHGLMTHTHSSNGHGHGSSMTYCTSQNCAPNNGTTCHGRTKKKGLLQRIKDSLDGHSSDSSDSESDDERSGKTRTMKKC